VTRFDLKRVIPSEAASKDLAASPLGFASGFLDFARNDRKLRL
jgi:hypothetical protein